MITGNADRSRLDGHWQHQFGPQGRTDFENQTLECYLAIINDLSTVFSEERDASTIAKAFDVLFLQGNQGSAKEQFDRELLTVWLNFANGAIKYDELFDPDRDGVATTFADLIAVSEKVRLNTTSTEAEIKEQKNFLHQINISHP